MTSILIIDDDVEFCAMLRDYMQSHEIQLTAEHEGFAGLAALREHTYEMVLLDVMLPDMDGLEVLSRVRQFFSGLSVLLLSAQGSEANRIAGLDEGADDYLPKPFNPRELVSRIRAILRRSERTAASSEQSAPERSSGLAVNSRARQAFYRGSPLPLTDVEFALLDIFLGSPGTVLGREDLVTRVFQRPFNPLDRSLDMHISRLRRKLSVVEELVHPIKTIRSSGYLFLPSAANS